MARTPKQKRSKPTRKITLTVDVDVNELERVYTGGTRTIRLGTKAGRAVRSGTKGTAERVRAVRSGTKGTAERVRRIRAGTKATASARRIRAGTKATR